MSSAIVKDTVSKLNAIPHWLIALLARFGLAGIFWRSGQTKVDGWEITDSTFYLFEEEYALPLLPPDVAAYLATAAEHLIPIMLVVGLGTRLGAAGLLGMTIVIQVFVYPNSWPDHLMWTAALMYLLARGPGCLSIDHYCPFGKKVD